MNLEINHVELRDGRTWRRGFEIPLGLGMKDDGRGPDRAKVISLEVGQLFSGDDGERTPWGIMVTLEDGGERFLPGETIAVVAFPAVNVANSASAAQEAAATKHAFQGQPGAQLCELCGLGPNSKNHRSLAR